MNIIDTRDLIEERDDLKDKIEETYNENLSEEDQLDYDDISESYKEENFEDEYNQIEEIDHLEDEIGGEFTYGCQLIDEDDFEEYTEDLLIDCGYIPKDFPSWIEIDWGSTAINVMQDYIHVDYQGNRYLVRP